MRARFLGADYSDSRVSRRSPCLLTYLSKVAISGPRPVAGSSARLLSRRSCPETEVVTKALRRGLGMTVSKNHWEACCRVMLCRTAMSVTIEHAERV